MGGQNTTLRSTRICSWALGLVILASSLAYTPNADAAGDTLRIGIPSDIESMDPHLSGGLSMRVWSNVYETLLSRGPDGTLEPRLATSWDQVDDTHIRFQLREGVAFTNGTPVNAQTVANVFNAKNDSASPHTHVSFSRWIKNVEPVDDHTIVLETDGPFPPTLFYLASTLPAAVWDVQAREEWGDLRTRSAGSGPYIVDEIRPGEFVQLRRNPDYWGGAPATEHLRFVVIPEESTRILALRRGEIDLTLDLGPAALSQLEGADDVKVNTYRAFRLNTLEYNFQNPLIRDNVELRRAIMLAIDTKAIADNIIGVMGDPADSVVLDVSWGYTSVPGFLDYDPERAAQILEQAGWALGADGVRARDGERLDLVLVTDFTRDYRNREVAQAVQAFLREVGINVELQLLERGPFIDTVVQRGEGYHLNIQGWGSPTNEASWWIYTRLHSDNQDLGAWGTSRTRMDRLDEMIDQARFELDEGKSLPLWHALQRMIHEEALMIPLYFSNKIEAVRTDVDGFLSHSDEWYGYRYLRTTVAD